MPHVLMEALDRPKASCPPQKGGLPFYFVSNRRSKMTFLFCVVSTGIAKGGMGLPGGSATNVEASQLFFRSHLPEVAHKVGVPEHHLHTTEPVDTICCHAAVYDVTHYSMTLWLVKQWPPEGCLTAKPSCLH